MFELILTACLATASQQCGPILLPQGRAETAALCEDGKERITQAWLASHPALVEAGATCVTQDDLPALPLREIADGVYMFAGQPVQMEGSPDGHIANLGVVIGDSVAVIDSGVSRAQGQQLYAAIRRLTDRPISHVILTHMHPDHVMGTQVFVEAGAKVVGHRALSQSLQLRGAGYLDGLVRLYGDKAILGTELSRVDIAVVDQMRLDLGGRELRLTPTATAHSDNDLTVFDPVAGVLFAGDLLFRQLTPVVDGSLTGWLEWQSEMPQPMPRVIVPGHGDIATSWEEAVTAQADFLNALAEATRRQIDLGLPMSEAVPEIVEDMAPLSPGWAAYPETVARDATAAYKELEWQ